jgi:hypothetical protein
MDMNNKSGKVNLSSNLVQFSGGSADNLHIVALVEDLRSGNAVKSDNFVKNKGKKKRNSQTFQVCKI